MSLAPSLVPTADRSGERAMRYTVIATLAAIALLLALNTWRGATGHTVHQFDERPVHIER